MVGGRIFIDRWNIRFESEHVSEQLAIETIEVEMTQDRVYFNDPSRPELRLFTSDLSVLKHPLLKNSRDFESQVTEVLGRRELKRAVRMTLYFVAGCVVITWLGSLAVSVMVGIITARVPMEWEQKFGKAEIEALQKGGSLVDDTNKIAQLTALAQPLIQVLPADRRDLKFYIKKDALPNAFALPGGYVIVHTGLLNLVERPEELLGVLAHEIAHETQRHIIRKIISASGPLVIFGVFLHSRSGAGNLLALGSGLIVFQGFSQSYETEADEVGWNYLVAANIDPRGMIRMFEKFKVYLDKNALPGFLPEAFDSHPALDKRIARLQGNWKKLRKQSDFLELPALTWCGTNTDAILTRKLNGQ